MPAPLVLAGLLGASALGGYLSNRKGARTGTSTGTSTSTPILNPQFADLNSLVLNSIMGRLGRGGLPPGYEAQGLANINQAHNLAAQATGNRLTTAGLARSPVAASVASQQELGRAGSIASFQNQLPLLADQMQLQDLGLAGGLLGNIGYGRTTTSSGEQVAPGSGLAGGFNSLGAMLGYLYGQGLLGAGKKGPSLLPGESVIGAGG